MAYQKGESGNPQGRPPGQTPGAKIRQAIEKHADSIVHSLIESAINGDTAAAKVLLDRVTPPLKPMAQPVQIAVGATLPESGANVVSATLGGDVPPDVGSALIRALAEQGKLIELQEMSERLQRLEKLLEART